MGTYYRDNPTDYLRRHADSLELLSPRFPFEWRQVTGRNEYMLIGKEENCLVLIADLHFFNSNFLLTTAREQLGPDD